ncbi:hypothetical protein, conserved [Leishmania donovani]|uniref:CSC1/OSCA1-like 7TM region domain-containing protein n=1 Tax=Leishmania donovani TaxID=5661 RepID=E9BCX8_LEIDO|nr:hypothetical protein, conserved [Leishmania donovani]AYU77703.1 protein of unknown function DUF221, putative [Leishmania donovani]CBZ33104.1 hypothetical protein, conserved [Leishmania donovani]
MSVPSPLPPNAKYDDQGIYLSFIAGGILLVVLGGCMAFLSYTPILWIKRFYRPNHTVEPAPLTRAASAAAVAAARRVTQGGLLNVPPPSSPLTEIVFAEHTVHPHGSHGHSVTRRKRLGISLPYLSTFFVRPTWQDWISIEEPSLRDRKHSALSPVHYQTPTLPTRQTSDRSFVPLQAPSYPAHRRRNGSHAAQPGSQRCGRDGASAAAGSPDFSPRHTPSMRSYGALEESWSRTSLPGTSDGATASLQVLPKTAVDPLVAVYLFTLKFFFSLMFLGELFTVWIMVIAQKDNYMEHTLIQRDIHDCKSQDNNATGCELRKPYCYYRGDGLGCGVVALHGLYDLTVLNISPRSQRWMGVGMLNLCFCVVLVSLTLLYLKKVGKYAEAVMANQMRHALGYRVVCVRGLDTTDVRTDRAFREAFLRLSVYFPNASPSPSASNSLAATAATSPGSGAQRRRGGGTGNPPARLDNSNGFDGESDSEASYVVCDCPGLNCLFSTAGMHYYVVRRSDAAFTEPESVEQILITREPPLGTLEIIADTEAAMANLQEAIADEKALQRRLTLRHETRASATVGRGRRGLRSARFSPGRTASVVVSNEDITFEDVAARHDSHADDGRDAVLMMRAPFPACCDKMPAVPYYEAVFFRCVRDMNIALERVPQQQVAGAAFVVFKDSLCAHEFTQLFTARFGGLFSSLTATIAGPPGRIFQSSLTAGRCALWLRFILIFLLYVVLLLTWSIPISILGSLEQLSEISSIAVLRKYSELPKWMRSLINAYLPVGALALLNIALPHIIRFLVRAMGAFNRAECDGGQLYMQYVFMVVTAVIFQAAFQGAVSRLADLLANSDHDAIINFFVSCISPSNGYFYAKVITATCLSTWVDLLDPVGILKVLLFRGRAHVQRNYDALFLPCEFEFPRLLSFDLMVLSMGLLFHMTAPLLGLLVVCYFFVRYWSQRAKQCDRYRPTLSPAHDCTDFGVAAQVIRCVMWLYCFSETCGVLLMSLRAHKGGVVMCSLALGTGVGLTIYVYVQTRKWTASLANARHFARKAHHFYSQHAVQQATSAPTVTTPLRGFPPKHAAEVSAGNAGTSVHVSPPSLSAGVAAADGFPSHVYAGSDNPYESEDDAAEQRRSPNTRNSAVQEEGALDRYENVTLQQVLFDATRNPFLSHLLPRKPGLTMRYQPKHQRLAVINAAAELRSMKNTDFVVERYWDRGMTWFEEDASVYRDLDMEDEYVGEYRYGDMADHDSSDGGAAARSLPRNDSDDFNQGRGEAPHSMHTQLMDGHDVSPTQASAAVPPSVNSRLRTAATVSTSDLSRVVPDNTGQKMAVVATPMPAVAATENAQDGAANHKLTYASIPTVVTAAHTHEGSSGPPSRRHASTLPPPPPLRSYEEQRADDELAQSLLQMRLQSSGPSSPRTTLEGNAILCAATEPAMSNDEPPSPTV